MIALRDVRHGDREMIRNWRNSPDVAKHMYSDHHITPEEHGRWFVRIMNDATCRYWVIICDGVDVGLADIYDLDERNRRGYWAFYVANPSVRGKGVGSFVEYSVMRYAFDELGLNKLYCEVLAFNTQVVNMHKSFGFQQEGILREHIFKGGQPFDIVVLAILHKEWEVRRPQIEERLRTRGLL